MTAYTWNCVTELPALSPELQYNSIRAVRAVCAVRAQCAGAMESGNTQRMCTLHTHVKCTTKRYNWLASAATSPAETVLLATGKMGNSFTLFAALEGVRDGLKPIHNSVIRTACVSVCVRMCSVYYI